LKCHIFRHLLAIIVPLILLQTTGQAAELCRQLYAKSGHTRPLPRGEFEFNDALSVQDNLAALARVYGIEVDWQRHSIDTFPWDFVSLLAGCSESSAIPSPEGVKQSLIFTSKNADNDSPLSQAPPVFSTRGLDTELVGERWAEGSRQYRFFNIGSRLLLKSASPEKLMALVSKFAKENPTKQIEIPFDPQWALIRQMINERQAVASQKGIRNYIEKKPYLAGEDLYELVMHDEYTKNSNDFLVLMKDTGKDPLTMTSEEFERNLAAMVRVARLNYGENWLMSRVLGGARRIGTLPHTLRLRPELKKTIESFLSEMSLRGLRIGELSRLNRFDNFSDAVMDAFLMKMFEVATVPGAEIDILLLECDARTARLFKRKGFHFKTMARVSPDGQEVPEYLQYLDTRTPEFRQAIANWAQSSQHIERQTVHEHAPRRQWSSFWEKPASFLNYWGKHKRHTAPQFLAGLKNRVRTENAPLSFALPSFKNKVVTNQARALEIARWILEMQTLPTEVTTALQRLTPEQKQKLSERVDLFSTGASDLFRSLTTKIGSREKALLIGEDAPFFASLLKEHFPTRQIETAVTSADVDPSLRFDQVVVLNQLLHHQGDLKAQQNVERIGRVLKPNGHGIFVDMFRDENPKSISQMLTTFALDAFQNGSPMTEAELALSLAFRKQTLEITTKTPLQSQQLFDWAEAADFQTDTRSLSFEGEDGFAGPWIDLRKRSP
jgi:SAM-dependent methyltransferase